MVSRSPHLGSFIDNLCEGPIAKVLTSSTQLKEKVPNNSGGYETEGPGFSLGYLLVC